MRIAGLQKCSMVDYPGKLAAVVFTSGCNLDCFYCHNRGLIAGSETLIPADTVLSWLGRRRGLVEAVVVSGGEPTLQPGLADFLQCVRNMEFLTKLDTNGTQPEILSQLIERHLLDFVAMDIKAPVGQYEQITCRPDFDAAVERSIDLLMASHVRYEFRTTFSPPLKMQDIVAIAKRIKGAKRYALQQYRRDAACGFTDLPDPHPESYVHEAAEAAKCYVHNCEVRGLAGAGMRASFRASSLRMAG